MQISTEDVGRILQSQAVTRTRLNVTNGYGRPVPPRDPTPASSVELSGQAQEIQNVKNMVDKTPDVREDLVQALKARVESGTYNVSGADIADLIVRRTFADTVR